MQTIRDLRAAGFTVQHAMRAINCTEISSKEPFWYCSRIVYQTMAEIRHNLRQADAYSAGFHLIVAGQYGDDLPYPLHILNSSQMADTVAAYDRHEAAVAAKSEAERDFVRHLSRAAA